MTGHHPPYTAEFLPSIISLAFVSYTSSNTWGQRDRILTWSPPPFLPLFLCSYVSSSQTLLKVVMKVPKFLGRLYYSGSIVTLVIVLMTMYLVISNGVGKRG